MNDVATSHGPMPVLTNPALWALVVVATVPGAVLMGLASGIGIFAGGVLGIFALAIVARLADELRTPTYDNKIDPWRD